MYYTTFKKNKKLILVLIFAVRFTTVFSQPDSINILNFKNSNYLFVINNNKLNLDSNKTQIYNYFIQKNTDSIISIDINSIINNKQKIKRGKLLKRNIFVFRNFDNVKLPKDLNWTENPLNNRNWQWYLHQLYMIDYLIAAHSSTNNNKYLDLAFQYTFDWCNDNLSKPYPSEFSWGDHSTAMRLQHLLYLYEYSKGLHYLNQEQFVQLVDIILLHINVLKEKHFYSKGKNHGLFQNYILLWALNIFPEYINYKEYNNVALKRTVYEISHQITNEGVHIENSPGYHFNHLVLMSKIMSIFNYFNIAYNMDKYYTLLNKGFEFLYYITKPNYKYPIIGDTEDKEVKENVYLNRYSSLSNFSLYKSIYNQEENNLKIANYKYYPQSGYFIYKSNNTADATHIIFKAGFLSFNHKHYDDLSFVLYAKGEDWIIDGGLYDYARNNKFREYFISNRAHNVVIPDSLYCIRKWKSLHKSKLDSFELNKNTIFVKGHHSLYKNYIVDRSITIYNDSVFVVTDSVTALNKQKSNYDLLLHIPLNKTIKIKNDTVTVQSDNYRLIISHVSSKFDKIDIVSGQVKPEVQAWISPVFKELKKAQCIIFRKQINNFNSKLKFEIKHN